MQKAAAETTAHETPTLEELRGRLAHLESRRVALERQLEEARAKETALTSTLEQKQMDLAEGHTGPEEVAGLVSKLDGHRAGMRILAEALRSVEQEAGEVSATVRGMERTVEKDRQTEAAEPLREEADRLLQDFIRGVTEVTAPLLRRQEVAARLAKEFPLAPGIEAVAFEGLVAKVGERLRSHPGVTAWLLRILAGPDGTPWVPMPRVAPEVFQRHGLK